MNVYFLLSYKVFFLFLSLKGYFNIVLKKYIFKYKHISDGHILRLKRTVLIIEIKVKFNKIIYIKC